MAIFYPDILQQRTAPRTFSYGDKDVMLYALGIGLGQDPMNETELAFVYEKGLKVVPTAATVLAAALRGASGPAPEMPPGHRPSQINFLMVVHGEQKVELHKPLPTSGTFTAEGRTIGAYDKGEGKGAVIINETVWTDEKGEKVATLTGSTFARGDGGFGGPSGPVTPPHPIPETPAQFTCDLPTLPQAALIYRLSGDYNPLHADPAYAAKAGFKAPILHGRATFSVVGHALVKTVCGYDPLKLKSMSGRFSSPVYPGETIRTEIWVDGKVITFRATVPARGVTVLNNGRAEIA